MSSYSPELIPECKETKLIRFQSRVVGLTKKPRRHSMTIVNLGLIISCIISGLVGLAYLAFDPIVRTIILNKLVMSNTSETYFLWEDPPITPHFKVYFLNLTNPEDVFNGISKPKLQEVGPYTYHQKWIKQNISWHGNGTISYKTRKVFTYMKQLSCTGCNESGDQITTLNVPVLSAYHQMRSYNWFSRGVLNQVISAIDYKPWITKTPNELTWGYDEPLFDLAKLVTTPPPFEQFGFFVTKKSADKHLGLYTMYTGQGNPYNLSNIAFYNGKKQLDFWKTKECNKVHGSDGASFNPYIKKEDTLWFFNDQLCRAMPLIFEKEIHQQGLPGMRFKPREDVFMSSQKYPQNSCFDGPGRTVGDGVFDLTICQFNTPIILSWPHFLDAEDKYSSSVEGLKPDKNKHGFWFDIQSVTGTTMLAKARVQINLFIKSTDRFDHLRKINDTVFPILWFEEGIDELGEDIITMLKNAAVSPETYKEYILYCLLGTGSTVFLLIFVAVTKDISNRTSTAKVEKVCDNVRDILHTGQVNGDQLGITQPMLLGYGDSSDSSQSTTASHSRNSSEGSAVINYAVINVDNNAFTQEVPGKWSVDGRLCLSSSGSNNFSNIIPASSGLV